MIKIKSCQIIKLLLQKREIIKKILNYEKYSINFNEMKWIHCFFQMVDFFQLQNAIDYFHCVRLYLGFFFRFFTSIPAIWSSMLLLVVNDVRNFTKLQAVHWGQETRISRTKSCLIVIRPLCELKCRGIILF